MLVQKNRVYSSAEYSRRVVGGVHQGASKLRVPLRFSALKETLLDIKESEDILLFN